MLTKYRFLPISLGRKELGLIVESPYLVGSDQNLNWIIFCFRSFSKFQAAAATLATVHGGAVSSTVAVVVVAVVAATTLNIEGAHCDGSRRALLHCPLSMRC
jgi:hypothetical protein